MMARRFGMSKIIDNIVNWSTSYVKEQIRKVEDKDESWEDDF